VLYVFDTSKTKKPILDLWGQIGAATMNALISRVFCIFYKPDIFTVLKVVCVLRAESFVGDIDLQPGSFRVNTSTFSCERY